MYATVWTRCRVLQSVSIYRLVGPTQHEFHIRSIELPLRVNFHAGNFEIDRLHFRLQFQ
jgi:hypothetical protein